MRLQRPVRVLFLDLLIIASLAKLIDTAIINLVLPRLEQIHEENHVIAECGKAVQGGHLDGEGEQIVNEGVEELVRHGAAGHVRDGLETVVDVQRGNHHEETVGVDRTYKGRDDEGVPALVRVVEQGVDGVGDEEGHGNHVQVFEGNLIVLFGLLLDLGSHVLVFKNNGVGEQRARSGGTDANIGCLGDLPGFNSNTHTLAEENHPGRVFVVVHEVQENDGLHKDVGNNGPDRGTNVVLLLAPVLDVVLEGKHLEDHVEDGDNGCDTEEVRVAVDQDLLEHLHLRSIATSWCRLTGSGSGSLGAQVLVDRGKQIELPVGQVIEIDVQWQSLDSIVELDHLLLELPEGVGVEDGVIPAMLTSGVARTCGVELHVFPGTRLHLRIAEDTRVGDHGDGEVGVIVVANDLACLFLFFRLDRILLRHVAEQVPRLLDLLLWLILRQGADKVVGLRGVVAGLSGVHDSTALGHIEVGEQRGIVLDLGRHCELDVDLPVLLVVAIDELLLVNQQRVLGHGFEGGHGDRRRDVHGNVELLAALPHGRDVPRDVAVLGILVELVRSVLPRRDRDSSTSAGGSLLRLAWLGSGGRRSLEEVLHAALDEQEHANALCGRLEELQSHFLLAMHCAEGSRLKLPQDVRFAPPPAGPLPAVLPA